MQKGMPLCDFGHFSLTSLSPLEVLWVGILINTTLTSAAPFVLSPFLELSCLLGAAVLQLLYALLSLYDTGT